MKTIRLGKTGLEVSRVGMGGIPITRPSEEEAIRVIQRALDLGVNLIDTAYSYGGGMSEKRIGKAISDRRDEVIIATKGGALEQIDESLKRLNTEYIDLWQIHGVSTFEGYEQVLKQVGTLQKVRKSGKVRHIGISSHNVDVALKAVASDLFETIQFPFNFVSNEAANELVSLAKKHDVGFIAMKPFAGGRIQNADLAIKYLLQFDNVVPDPGIEKMEEIEEIVDIVNNRPWELTPQDHQEIKEIRARLGTRFCRQCGYCMPCPEGVIIYGVIYLKILYDLWPEDWFFSWNYVKGSVESAKNCIQCGECEKKCPFQLPIREMIKENIEFYENVKKSNKMESE